MIKVKNPRAIRQALDGWDSQEILDQLLDAAEKAAEALLREIRRNAHHMSAEWGRVADAGRVQRQPGNVVLMFPEAAFDLEYGTEDDSPQPVIRQTINSMQATLSKEIKAAVTIKLYGGS